eukprot:CAMPEP_0172317480 /NCGR_PEP_ID=MMETSP1058-20130122/31761_1 /TAXON_ID=83371 /ORGANISM="Detonula confervacea, Strain CCMP 353" /LENGTH=279 /DNA_ID=CAMNT_0013032055 /DNA_START=38 /DNA_END=873 /DNA_ORIENTATION=+
MTNYHAMAMAARQGRRTLNPSIMAVAQRSHHVAGSASLLSSNYCSLTTTEVASITRIPIPMGATRRIMTSTTASVIGNAANNSRSGHSSFAALATIATSLAVATGYTLASSPSASCESTENNGQSAAGLADESEEDANGTVTNIAIRDGMDAGSSESSPKSSLADNNGSVGPADADEDNGNASKNNNDDDDDDASNDEDTTCSICLINRQGPCRKYWLKFERCMKEHGAEKDRVERKKATAAEAESAAGVHVEADGGSKEGNEKDDEDETVVVDDGDGG